MSRDNPDDSTDASSEHRDGLTRRRMVATGAATWASVALAGCDRLDDPNQPIFGDDGGDGEDGGDGGDGGDGSDGGDGGQTTVTNETTTTDDPGGGGDTPTPTGTPCASVKEFAPGMEIGLHVNVFESATGEFLGDDSLDSVTIEFPDSEFESRELSWAGSHEEYSEASWGTKIETSEDIESGAYRYEITVEGEDVTDEPETITDKFFIV